MHTVLTEVAWFFSVPKQMSYYIQLRYDNFLSLPFSFINLNQSFDVLQFELLTTSLKNHRQVKFKFKDSGPRMGSHIAIVVRSAFRPRRTSMYVSNVSSKNVLAKIMKILKHVLQSIRQEGHLYFLVVNNVYALHLRKLVPADITYEWGNQPPE